MKFKKLLIKCFLFAGVFGSGLFLTCGHVLAETLDDMVQEALTSNPDLAALKASWEQSTYKGAQVGSLSDPVLSFALSNYPSDSLSSRVTPMTGNELKLAQAFPFPGKLDGRSAIADEQARWLESVYLDRHYQVARQVKDAWYRLYFKEQSIAVTERNMALVNDVIRLTEVRYETGEGLQQDVLKAQVQRSKLMERLMSLRQQRSVVKAELNRLLNRASDHDYTVPEKLDLVETGKTLDELRSAALEQRPMVSAYRSLIKKYRQQQKLAKLNDYPDMTLWASWRFRDDDLPDKGTDFVSAGVSFTLPVYREKRRAETAEADAGLRMVERQTEAFHNSVSESIENAYTRMQETHQQTRLYEGGIIPQTSQSLQAALSSYQVGKVAFVSLLDSLMTTYQAEMEYYRVSSEYMRSLAWLEAESTVSLIGQPLKLAKPISSDLTK